MLWEAAIYLGRWPMVNIIIILLLRLLPHHPRPAGCGRLPRTWSTWTPGSPGSPPSLRLTHFHWLSARYFFTFSFQLCLSFEQVFRVGYNLPGPLGQYSLLAKVTEMEETKWDSRKQLALNKHLSFYLQRKIVLEAENFLSPKITAVFSQVCHNFFSLVEKQIFTSIFYWPHNDDNFHAILRGKRGPCSQSK